MAGVGDLLAQLGHWPKGCNREHLGFKLKPGVSKTIYGLQRMASIS